MMTFLEYLEEYKRRIKEDVVMAASAASNAGAEVTSPAVASTQNVKAAEVVSQHDAAIPTSDRSVLGPTVSKKKCKDCGFFGKDDFRIPQNVLSGEVDRRIELKNPPHA